MTPKTPKTAAAGRSIPAAAVPPGPACPRSQSPGEPRPVQSVLDAEARDGRPLAGKAPVTPSGAPDSGAADDRGGSGGAGPGAGLLAGENPASGPATSTAKERAEQRKAWGAAISARNATQRRQRAVPRRTKDPYSRAVPGAVKLPPGGQEATATCERCGYPITRDDAGRWRRPESHVSYQWYCPGNRAPRHAPAEAGERK
jgi:hypothetical protein